MPSPALGPDLEMSTNVSNNSQSSREAISAIASPKLIPPSSSTMVPSLPAGSQKLVESFREYTNQFSSLLGGSSLTNVPVSGRGDGVAAAPPLKNRT
jgi:hypothetical protein